MAAKAPPGDADQYTVKSDRQYRDNTYLTLQINKGFDSTGIDLSENTFGKFVSQLQEIDQRKAEHLQPVLKDIENMAYGRVQSRNYIAARNKLNGFIEAKQNRDEGTARRAAFDLYAVLGDSIGDLQPGADGEPIPNKNKAALSESRVQLLLNRLRAIADAQTAQDQLKFTIQGFPNAFPRNDPDGFESFFRLIYERNVS